MITLKKDGFYLTQNADVDIKDRILTESVYMPDSGNVDYWKFISEEEFLAYKKMQEEAMVAEEEIINLD